MGEAYEDQGNAGRALAYYTQAAATARTVRAMNPAETAGQLNDVLDYARELLIAHRRFGQLHAWAREALELLKHLETNAPAAGGFPTQVAELHLTRAAAFLAENRPDSTARALTLADAALTRFFRIDGPRPNYFERRLDLHALRARLAQRQGAGAATIAEHRRRALAELAAIRDPQVLARARRHLVGHLLALGDGATAARVAQPLVDTYQRQGARLFLREAYQLLRRAHAQQRRYDSAYHYAERYRQLSDTLRAADQYAALAAVETRYRTREQATQIGRLTEQADRQRQRQTRIVAGSVALLLLLAGVAWAWRRTRRLNQRLAELDGLKDQFFANVSHELRTPLTLIVGPAELLLTDPESGLPATARQPLGLLLRNAQRLQQLVNQLLDFTKLEAGRLRPDPAPVRPALLVGQVVDGFRLLAESRGIALGTDLRVGAEISVLLDAGKVEHILGNLLSNALKFTSSGGRVTIELDHAPGPDHSPTALRIRVIDTGPGIAPDEQAKVFERFYQTRQRHAAGGTGIGLALARELAELLGGGLTLSSRVGEGSAFLLTLPVESVSDVEDDVRDVEDVEDVQDVEDVLHSVSSVKPRLLVVEDNADLRAFLRQVLEPTYEVLEAADGRAALALLATESVDLISSDEMMPGMSGIELFEALRAQSAAGPRVPFLLLTARADPQHRMLALELGVDDYLHKPFAPRELLARVHNLLTNYRERQRWTEGMEGVRSEVRGARSADGSETETASPLTSDLALGTSHLAPSTSYLESGTSELIPLADQELLRRLRERLESALADSEFDPTTLAGLLDVSERTLYRKLKELTGLTPAAYLRELRLERARQLLEARTTRTVAEVAYAVGFDDPQYFAKVFLKRYGKRASEYLRG